MKENPWIIAAAVVLASSSQAQAADYTSPVNTNTTTLQAGDSVTITTGNAPAVTAGSGAPALNITGGGVALENSSAGGGSVLDLNNALNNSLGVGSVITRTGPAANPLAINIFNSGLQAEQLTLNGGTIQLRSNSPSVASVNFLDSIFTSSSNYLFRAELGSSVSLTNATVNHSSTDNDSRTISSLQGGAVLLNNVSFDSSASQVISLDRGAHTAEFNEVTIRHNTTSTSSNSAAIRMYSNALVTGRNLDIESSTLALHVGAGVDARFTGENKILSHSGRAIEVFSLTAGTPRDTHLSLESATVTSGNNAALFVQGAQASALIQNSTLTGVWSVYAVANGQVTVEDSHLQMVNPSSSQSFVVLAASGAVVDLQGANSVNAVGNNLAMFATDSGKITANGKLESSGRIYASNGGVVDFALSDSVIDAQIGSDASSFINWVDSGSTWNVLGDSNLNQLRFGQGSIINLQAVSDNLTLTVTDLVSTEPGSRGPLLRMKANVESLTSDFVRVTNSSAGNFWVDIPNDASEINNGQQVLDLINTADGQATFVSNKLVEKGGYYYTVARSASDPAIWQLIPTVGPTPEPPDITSTGRGGANVAVASHLLNYASQQSMIDRLSVLRLNPREQGTWIRVYHGDIDLKTERIKDSDLTYSGLQLGHDRVVERSADSYWLVGGMLEYLQAKQRYDAGKNRLNAYSAALYASKFYDSGLYFDGLLKYSALRNSVDTTDTQNASISGHDNTQAVSLSAEVGKTIRFAESEAGVFFVQPQLQLTASRIGGHNFKHSNGLEVKARSETSLLARTGVNLGYQFAGHPSTIYLKLGWLKEFDGDVNFTLNGTPEHIKAQNNWLEVGVGAQIALSDQQKLFVEAKGSDNGRFSERKFNVGYRWDF